MGGAGDDLLRAEAADDVSCLIELAVRSKAGTRSIVAIEETLTRQLDGSGSNIGCVGDQVAEMPFQTQCPGLKIAIAEAGVDTTDRQAE